MLVESPATAETGRTVLVVGGLVKHVALPADVPPSSLFRLNRDNEAARIVVMRRDMADAQGIETGGVLRRRGVARAAA